MKKYPNWLEMPEELMAYLLLRLRTGEILNSARKVCTSWRRICSDPEWWKVIKIHKLLDGCDTDSDVEIMTKLAVDLSCGELIDFSIRGFCTDEFLEQIVLRSSKLKRLCVRGCYKITGSGLSRAVKRVPQLEELHNTSASTTFEDIEIIGQYCPQLKSFETVLMFEEPFTKCDDHVVAIAKSVPNLLELRIYGEEITDVGFQAILNGFPNLQFLGVFMEHRCHLNRSLVKKCMEQIKEFKHNLRQEHD